MPYFTRSYDDFSCQGLLAEASSLAIYFFASWVLAFIVIGLILMPALVILNIIFVVLAAVKASNGESYVYPLSIKFLK